MKKKIYWAGCNYYTNKGLNENEPLGTATSMHDCIGCDKMDTCNMKKDTEIWELKESK